MNQSKESDYPVTRESPSCVCQVCQSSHETRLDAISNQFHFFFNSIIKDPKNCICISCVNYQTANYFCLITSKPIESLSNNNASINGDPCDRGQRKCSKCQHFDPVSKELTLLISISPNQPL